MLRLPSAAGRFYPSNPGELTEAIRKCLPSGAPETVTACLVPHAGYVYSGRVTGEVFSHIALPPKILILGVRHFPRGQNIAIVSSGSWRTPLGDAVIDEPLAAELRAACPSMREDTVAHAQEHSIEVQLPFLQTLQPKFTFVPLALGAICFDELAVVGEAIRRVLSQHRQDTLLLVTSDLNHYEDDATTRTKDHKAIERLLAFDPRGLFDVCRKEEISMCGLCPAVVMLFALHALGASRAKLLRYATSADASGDTTSVVGYAGMIFS